eukprot:TRINITY_DN6627_c0_g1_i5.p1 TRINITY_DN6627_c0_g1~~TRINITY_DN6627_c0_g1_i5.p1  ORF type:complete len:187 (-),score=67.02 TRINITY_DN6627_c0_g1_i5:60-620(-)
MSANVGLDANPIQLLEARLERLERIVGTSAKFGGQTKSLTKRVEELEQKERTLNLEKVTRLADNVEKVEDLLDEQESYSKLLTTTVAKARLLKTSEQRIRDVAGHLTKIGELKNFLDSPPLGDLPEKLGHITKAEAQGDQQLLEFLNVNDRTKAILLENDGLISDLNEKLLTAEAIVSAAEKKKGH